MRNVRVQVCFYPLCDGGFYLTHAWDRMNRRIRLSAGLVDRRHARIKLV